MRRGLLASGDQRGTGSANKTVPDDVLGLDAGRIYTTTKNARASNENAPVRDQAWM